MLAGGVSVKELAEYLGHSDPAFTLRVYAHMLPCSYDRARAVITERFTRMISGGGRRSYGPETRTVSAVQSYRTSSPVMARPMMRRWISEVPSKMVNIFASRCQRSTGNSRV
jgi:hypothetical protein